MKWFRFIFSHSLFVSFCAAALTLHTAVILDLQPDAYGLALVFFSTLLTYNLYWLLSAYAFEKRDFHFILKHRYSGLIMTGVSLSGTLFSLSLRPDLFFRLLIPATLTFVYFLPVMYRNPPLLFRKAGAMKTWLLALTWTWVTVTMAFPSQTLKYDTILIFLSAQRFLFMLMICIIFDSRDVNTDKIHALQSLATEVSKPALSIIFSVSLFLFMVFTWLMFGHNGLDTQFSCSVMTGLCAGLLYLLSGTSRGYFFYYFLVDGLMILLASSSLICFFFD